MNKHFSHALCLLLFVFAFRTSGEVLNNSRELQGISNLRLANVGVLFDGGSFIFTFYVVGASDSRMLDILLRDFANDQDGARYSLSKSSRQVQGVWIEYAFYNKGKNVRFDEFSLVDRGGSDEKKIIKLINMVGGELPVVQKEYFRILAEIIKTRDVALKDMFYQISYRDIFYNKDDNK